MMIIKSNLEDLVLIQTTTCCMFMSPSDVTQRKNWQNDGRFQNQRMMDTH